MPNPSNSRGSSYGAVLRLDTGDYRSTSKKNGPSNISVLNGVVFECHESAQ